MRQRVSLYDGEVFAAPIPEALGAHYDSEPTMNAASSERLVVFVTPAQKRVLAARAARMGISVSELVRRAVLAFDDTGQEVRAAGLIDRLGAASEASATDPLRRLAQAGQHGHERGMPLAGRAAPAPGEAVRPAETAAGDSETVLPVAAAVARALVAQDAAQTEDIPDPETQALVGRLLGSEPPGSV